MAHKRVIKAVLFDLDDTLLDRAGGFVRMCRDWYRTLPVSGRPADEEQFVERMAAWDRDGLPKHEIYGNLLLWWPGCFAGVEAAIDCHRTQLARFAPLDPRTRVLLVRLRHEGFGTAVVSNGSSAAQQSKVRHWRLSDLVDAIVVSEEIGATKAGRGDIPARPPPGRSRSGAHTVRGRPASGGHRRRAGRRHADLVGPSRARVGSRSATAGLRDRRRVGDRRPARRFLAVLSVRPAGGNWPAGLSWANLARHHPHQENLVADHRFVPAIYHTTLGPHDPVLTIESGDRVFTTTVDAGGFDASDIAVTPGGNPQTGPFRVAGAEAGDTLAVHLEQIRPNRARGYTKTWVAPNVLDPGHPTLPGDLPHGIDWAVDVEAGVASPLGVPELAHWRVPLAPMIGCFGVAPERHQAISTATSVLGIAGGVGGSRVVRGAVVATKGNDYFLAAKAVGAPTTQILVRHDLPNIVAPLIIVFSINVGGVILAEASLSFLGFGLPIKGPELGRDAQPGGAAVHGAGAVAGAVARAGPDDRGVQFQHAG